MSELVDQAVEHMLRNSDAETVARQLYVSQACRLTGLVESPIEMLLGMAFLTTIRIIEEEERLGFLLSQDEFEKIGRIEQRRHIYIVPQYKWSRYRSDFLIATSGGKFLVECDGHDYHERTKKQAAHDRRRDREAQHLGYLILRFTGSEIFADVSGCVRQIVDFLIVRRNAAEASR